MHGEGAPEEGDGRPSADAAKNKLDPSAPQKADDSEGSSTEDEESKEDSDKLERMESDDNDADSELEALLREDSEISSSSSEGEQHLPASKVRKKGKRKGHSTDESPVSTIGVLVVACWTLRIPIMLRDLTRCVGLACGSIDPLRFTCTFMFAAAEGSSGCMSFHT